MPALTTELRQMILTAALSVPGSASRQRDRLTFRKVCKEWQEMIYPWKEIEVIGIDQLEAVTLLLGRQRKAQTRLLIKSVYVELTSKGHKRKAEKLARLFELAEGLKRVETVTSPKIVSKEEDDALGKVVREALQGLVKLRQFTLAGQAGHDQPTISLETLEA